jgi:hypothetical protein
MAVAATTDMMRVFLWVATSSWETIVVNEGVVFIAIAVSSSIKIAQSQLCRDGIPGVKWLYEDV